MYKASRRFVLAIGFIGGITSLSVAGEIGSVRGGSFQSAEPVQEQLQFGDVKTIIERLVVQVPEAYGKLMQIVPSGSLSTLWFQDDDGNIRNVVVTTDKLWILQRKGSVVKK